MNKRLIYTSLLGLMALCSCESEPDNPYAGEDTPGISIVSADLVFEATGGSGSIVYTSVSNAPVNVSSEGEWCYAYMGENNTVVIEVEAYGGLESRYSRVRLSRGAQSASVVVQQKGAWLRLKGGNMLKLDDSEALCKIPFSGNIVPKVEDLQDWTVSRVEADTVYVSVGANTTGSMRFATVRLSYGDNTEDLGITQVEVKDMAGEYRMCGLDRRSEPASAPCRIDYVNDTTLNIVLTDLGWTMRAAFSLDDMTLCIPNASLVGKINSDGTDFYVLNMILNHSTLTGNYSISINNYLRGGWDAEKGRTVFTCYDNGEWPDMTADGMFFVGFTKYENGMVSGSMKLFDFFGYLTLEAV